MGADPIITNYAALDLLLWQEQGSLELSPKFQRRPVWSSGAKSYFIDTILRGFPVPPLHVRLSEGASGVRREVIDGQQRLRTLFDFYEGRFRLKRSPESPWSGKPFGELDEEAQTRLKLYSFQAYQYQGISDELVLEIFARINTYSVALSAQELRNGRWFGDFKQTAYALSLEFLEFWRRFRVFTESGIARMREAELVSELLVLQLAGFQDKKSSLDSFYAQLDEDWGDVPRTWNQRAEAMPLEWHSRLEASDRFRSTMNSIAEHLGDILPASEFRRVPLFYTLYSVVYHAIYGVPGVARPGRHGLSSDLAERLRLAVVELSDLVADKPSEESLRGWQREFVVASARQTDNIGPRQVRFEVLCDRAEMS